MRKSKTVRVDMEDYVSLLMVKHELEIEKRDMVNMSDVLKVVMKRYDLMKEGASFDEAVEEARKIKLMGIGQPRDDEDEDDDEIEEAPRPKRKAAATRKTKKRVVEDEDE